MVNEFFLVIMKKILALIIAPVMAFAQPALAQPVSPSDFAYGIPIDTVGGQPIQSLIVPQTVYEHISLTNLADVRVFNAAGIPVPHAVHRIAEQPDAQSIRHDLPIFPVYGRTDEALGNLNVRVRRDAAGTLIQVDERTSDRPTPLRAYLVDASRLEQPVNEMMFHWTITPRDLLARVTVETSDDLLNWQAWGAAGTLASIRHDDQVLVRNMLDLPVRKARYYRLSWPANTVFPELARLEVATTSARPDAERYWLNVPMQAADDGVFTAEINPAIPFDRLAIDLPASQRIVRVRVTSSETADGPEIQHFQGLAYHLNAGEDSWVSPSTPVYYRGHRYWKLTVLRGDAPMLGGAPSLRIGWTPSRVMFVPQGEAPFTLAYGNSSAEPAEFSSQELFLPIQHSYRDVFDVPLASAGEQIELGGAARLERVEEIPWERVALWASLLAGVAILALLSLRLLRQTTATNEGSPES